MFWKNLAVLDVETTTILDGNPFHPDNDLCFVGIRLNGENKLFNIEYDMAPYGSELKEIQKILDHCAENNIFLVGANIKFDLHWIRRYGIRIPNNLRVVELQVLFNLIQSQQVVMPSLDDMAFYCGLPKKLDIVKNEYWEKGIDTKEVPENILREYLEYDLELENNCAIILLKQLPERLHALFKLMCADLLILEDMEYNGMKYNIDKSHQYAQELATEVEELKKKLSMFLPEEVRDKFNWGSPDQLSCFLYGGSITYVVKEPFLFTYKDGRQKEKLKNVNKEVKFNRVFTPLDKTGLAKPGFFSTQESILRKLKCYTKEQRQILSDIISIGKKETLISRYFIGIPKKMMEMKSTEFVHGSFHQTVAITGRLSSANPNLQNITDVVRVCLESRF